MLRNTSIALDMLNKELSRMEQMNAEKIKKKKSGDPKTKKKIKEAE